MPSFAAALVVRGREKKRNNVDPVSTKFCDLCTVSINTLLDFNREWGCAHRLPEPVDVSNLVNVAPPLSVFYLMRYITMHGRKIRSTAATVCMNLCRCLKQQWGTECLGES